jgi:hypothetical protein
MRQLVPIPSTRFSRVPNELRKPLVPKVRNSFGRPCRPPLYLALKLSVSISVPSQLNARAFDAARRLL